MSTHLHRKFTPDAILSRAWEYGMQLYLKDGELVIESPSKLEPLTRERALSVIADSREEIVAYLKLLDEYYRHEIEEEAQFHPEICCVCLDQGKETSALSDDHSGLMYCAWHHPKHQPICRAISPLNEKGQMCKAREKVAKTEACGSTAWLQTPSGVICAKCYTPMPKEESA